MLWVEARALAHASTRGAPRPRVRSRASSLHCALHAQPRGAEARAELHHFVREVATEGGGGLRGVLCGVLRRLPALARYPGRADGGALLAAGHFAQQEVAFDARKAGQRCACARWSGASRRRATWVWASKRALSGGKRGGRCGSEGGRDGAARAPWRGRARAVRARGGARLRTRPTPPGATTGAAARSAVLSRPRTRRSRRALAEGSDAPARAPAPACRRRAPSLQSRSARSAERRFLW